MTEGYEPAITKKIRNYFIPMEDIVKLLGLKEWNDKSIIMEARMEVVKLHEDSKMYLVLDTEEFVPQSNQEEKE